MVHGWNRIFLAIRRANSERNKGNRFLVPANIRNHTINLPPNVLLASVPIISDKDG